MTEDAPVPFILPCVLTEFICQLMLAPADEHHCYCFYTCWFVIKTSRTSLRGKWYVLSRNACSPMPSDLTDGEGSSWWGVKRGTAGAGADRSIWDAKESQAVTFHEMKGSLKVHQGTFSTEQVPLPKTPLLRCISLTCNAEEQACTWNLLAFWIQGFFFFFNLHLYPLKAFWINILILEGHVLKRSLP